MTVRKATAWGLERLKFRNAITTAAGDERCTQLSSELCAFGCRPSLAIAFHEQHVLLVFALA